MAIKLSDSQMLTKEQLAELLNLTPSTIDHMRQKRMIPALRFGYRTYRFERGAIERALGKLEQHEIGR